MAKGGSGDVLTGVIAGLVALGLEESDAAALAFMYTVSPARPLRNALESTEC